MDRREALRSVAILFGTAISAGTTNILFSSYTQPLDEKNAVKFSLEQIKVLGEIADVIIPTTKSSGGAKAAGMAKFIPMMVNDCYPAKNQHEFMTGLKEFEKRAKDKFKKSFALIPLVERRKMLEALRTETIDGKRAKEKSAITYFFNTVRDLTVLGYFSSEIGCTQARAYVAIPGEYNGEALLKPGQKSWA
jgi:hypothetical protein